MKCKVCRKTIINIQNAMYCSVKCRGTSRRKPMPKCIRCNKPVKWRGTVKFCSNTCAHFRNFNPRWKGGFKIDKEGYRHIWISPNEREHRYLMEKHIGRKLKKSEVIHHKNGNKLDNRIKNLEITNQSIHQHRHMVKKL